jgi:hypothetical protein
VREQPGNAVGVPRDGVAEQIVERRTAEFRNAFSPSCAFSAFFRLRPQQIEPERVIGAEGGVVERLAAERIGAARDQHAGELLRLRVRGLPAFAAADNAGEDLEGVLAVGPPGPRVGALVEQQAADLDRIALGGLGRQTRVGKTQERRPGGE